MLHSVMNKLSQERQGVKIDVKIAAPAGMNVSHLLEKFKEVLKLVDTDPNQLGLEFEEEKGKEE